VEGVIAILMPVMIVFIVTYYRFRAKQLALEEKKEPNRKLLEAADKEKKALEARIQNLESIVCSVDFELNQRMNRVLAEHSVIQRVPLLQAPNPGGTMAASKPPTSGGARAAQPSGHEETQPGYAYGQLAPGQVVLGRYTIERELGRGGMGAVYLARDSKLSERVALKTISAVLAADPEELVQRLRLEVQAARKVTHPNVIRIHDLGEDGPLIFISMEYIEGETLHARVKRLAQLPISEARSLLLDVTAGVAAAHAAGIIHRDLKPQNVLVAGGTARAVKVIDFGLAKSSFSSGMTATGLIMGTPEYMAPEQVRGRRSDSRTDVYALGAIAYYMLTGKPPFTADTPIAVGFAQVHETPVRPRELRPEVPQKVEEIVLRALEKDPLSRYRDAAELREALESS
jgi:eukaryotic-like serine/threonine-protein kinase